MPPILRLRARTGIIGTGLPRRRHLLQQPAGDLHFPHSSQPFQSLRSTPKMDIPLLPLDDGNQIPMVSSM